MSNPAATSWYRMNRASAERRFGHDLGTNSERRQNENQKRLREEDHALILGRQLAATAIAGALVHGRDATDRSIGRYSRLHTATAVASGWLLCEGVFDRTTGQPSTRQINGLLLARGGAVYAYSADLRQNRRAFTRTTHDTTAWGREALVVPESQKNILACTSIAEVPLGDDPLYVDRQIGAFAGSLTLEDLFGGLIVRKQSLSGFSGDIPLTGLTGDPLVVPVVVPPSNPQD